MAIWTGEVKELERLFKTVNDNLPILGKEIEPLIKTHDANVVMLYARRCLEVVVTELCETELKRPRKTEPLKGIIDKLNNEDKVPSHIITSMHSLNSLATFGTHPKDFDPEQVKPVLNNLSIVIKWYLKFKGIGIPVLSAAEPVLISDGKEEPGILHTSGLEKSIAVLPFINDSPDQENTYFINGVMEEILNNLQKIKDLRVISRTSVEQYRGQSKPISEIAEELGVNYIVEGSGQKYGNALRLRAQLILAVKESHLWGESFQQKITEVEDIFNIQTQIAESIAAELKAVMSPKEKQRIEKIPATDLAVYEEYLKARSYWNDFSRESLNKAIEFLNSAVEKDPDWAPLYAGLTKVWMGIQQMGYEPPSIAAPKIFENLNKALELDPDLAEVHYFSAMIAHLMEWDWQKSEKEFLEALAINPNDSLSRVSYAQLLCVLQRTNEGITQGRLALDLDPLNPYVKCLYGAILPCVGDCKTAIDLAEKVTVADQGNYLANNVILLAAYQCKEYDKVIKAERYNLPVFNVKEDEINEIERIFNEQGFIKTYEKIMIRLEKFAENNPISPSDMAIRYIMANQPDKALDWIEKGFELHDPGMTYIATKIFNLDPLFNNPRFINIVEKMNLQLPKN